MSILRKIALALVLLVLVVLGVVAWMLRSRAEEIPDELPPINTAEADPQKLVVPGQGGLDDLVLADLKGRTVYLIVEDRESMAARESSAMSRAMARWVYPENVSGFAIGDAEGFGLLASKIEEFVGPMRPELRLPLYIDFQGVVTRTFKLPKGHVGVVVLDPTGAVVYRHSGKMEPDEIEKLRELLGASLPAPSPAPAFKVGELDNAACAGRTCALVFLGGPVARKDIPGGKQGFDGSMDESVQQFAKPDIRLAGIVIDSDAKLDSGKVSAQLVGQIDGAELKRWKSVPDAPEARAAFEIPAGEAALVVIDPKGDVVMRELGRLPMYKFGVLSEFIGVELSDRDDL